MFNNQLSALGQFQGIQLETDISVITVDDNINHTYCSKIKWEQDNRMPIGVAQLIMPYSTQIASYWMKYNGTVVIHANFNSRPHDTTQAMLESLPTTMSLNMKKFLESQIDDEDNKKISAIQNDESIDEKLKAQQLKKARNEALESTKKKLNKKKNGDVEKDEKTKQLHLKNDEYNYAYIGKVARFKQVGTTFIVYLEDLGWKFMQKVPKAFRDTYISGQSLDNAFQAICEFMGVEFAYSIEDLSGYNFGADGYSVEKDGKVIEDVSTILSEWANEKEEDEEDEEMEDASKEDIGMGKALNDSQAELSGLNEYNQKKKKNNSKKKSNKKNKKNNDTALNAQATNTSNDNKNNTNDTNNKKNKKDNDKQQTANDKIEKYQEEFDDKIKHLFIGNTFYDSNISDPILNYTWISVTPTAPQSTASNTTTNTQTNDQNNPNNTNNSTNSNNSGNSNNNTS